MNNENYDEPVRVQVLEINIVKNLTIATVQLLSGEIKRLLTFKEKESRRRWHMTGGPSFSNPSAWEKGLRSIVLRYEGPLEEANELFPGTELISTNTSGQKE